MQSGILQLIAKSCTPAVVTALAEENIYLTPELAVKVELLNRCKGCKQLEHCQSTGLPQDMVVDLMQLLQSVSPSRSYYLYEECFRAYKGIDASQTYQQHVLTLLDQHSHKCSAWR